MSIQSRILTVILTIGISVSLIGCTTIANAIMPTPDPQISPTAADTATITATPFQALTNTPTVIPPTYTPTSTFTPIPTDTPTPTDTPVPTDTPIPTPTSASAWNPAGHVIAPILLYHHVSDAGNGNRYYVTLNDFRAQLQALRDWGYTSITVSDLVEVLINGGELPDRPVVITFDDGNIDIYQNAFPIMHEMGFVGTFYIVANRLQSKYYVNVDQIKEMANDGWEIGSHAMSHVDLTLDYSIVRYEVLQSRLDLEEATGEPINTFAYPYGETDAFISDKVSEYGYRAAMGLGARYEHTLGTLFYLSRIEVQGSYNLTTFAHLLPWSGN